MTPIFQAAANLVLKIGAAFALTAGVIGFKPGEYSKREKPDGVAKE